MIMKEKDVNMSPGDSIFIVSWPMVTRMPTFWLTTIVNECVQCYYGGGGTIIIHGHLKGSQKTQDR